MGAPQHILPADLEVLRRRMELDVAVERAATPEGRLEWAATVKPFGVTLVEISAAGGWLLEFQKFRLEWVQRKAILAFLIAQEAAGPPLYFYSFGNPVQIQVESMGWIDLPRHHPGGNRRTCLDSELID